MILRDITEQNWILAMFIRSDGERFLLGDAPYDFNSSQQHFAANSVVNDLVDVQGGDGSLLAGQVLRATTQEFNGYIGTFLNTKVEIEKARERFIAFFAKGYFYDVVYIFTDGTAIRRQRGFLVDAPAVTELFQQSPSYHVALSFEDINYYSYAEDDDGNPIYSGEVEIEQQAVSAAGLVWDEVGIVWDDMGAIWEGAGSGITTINVDSPFKTYPIWVVQGSTTNPSLEVLETGTNLHYNGVIAEGQELVVDCYEQTALLNGLSVIENIEGDWLVLNPGINRINYSTAQSTTGKALLKWNEVVG